MLSGIKIRFQHWVLLSTILLVTLLSVSILYTVSRSFKQISEDNATTRFALLADRASARIEGLVQQSAKFVAVHAQGDIAQFVVQGRINSRTMVPIFLASLETDATIYSHFFALDNEEFLQVINLRADEQIVAALQAPREAYFAIRHIHRQANGSRTDRYEFLDARRIRIGSREQPATLVPTQRPWYGAALKNAGIAVAAPYLFASTGELGVTVAAPLPQRAGVIATDITLRSLQSFLAGLALPANGAIALVDEQGRVLAFHGQGERFAGLSVAPMTPADQIGNPYLTVLKRADAPKIFNLGPGSGEPFVVSRLPSAALGETGLDIVVMAPLSDFTALLDKAQRDVTMLVSVVLLILLPLAFFGSRQVARTLEAMALDSERLKQLDFSRPPSKAETFLYEIDTLGAAQHVLHDTIRERTRALIGAQGKLEYLIQSGIELGRERDRIALLRKILLAGKELLNCDAGTVYLATERGTLRFALRTRSDELPSHEIPLYDENGQPVERYMASWCVLHNAPVIVDDVYRETRFDVSGAKQMDRDTGYRSVSMLSVPMSQRQGEVIGVLQFLNAIDPDTGAIVPFSPELVRFVSAMATQAAVALDNHQLLEAQIQMLDAVIKLVAGAIDAKSPYTGGHCERVPQLGVMLAQAACDASEGSLAGFRFDSEEEWHEFRVGAWLHDCGKLTTPEYVVDKGVKLETIYNRIHEVRMRFEVVLRDARIAALEAIVAGADPAVEMERFEQCRQRLSDDFAFVAACNEGGEFLAPEKIDRLRNISQTTWLRHFDDRLGLTHEELVRFPADTPPLPVVERLLSDKPQHIVPRTRHDLTDPKWGFKITVPEHQYNYGELYNLSIGRGTLTEEERFKINEHVMHSLMMLEQLPLPRHMRRVPQIAGTHHETLIGTGYPRQLTAAELSIPMRIMAIADIFEALTASDRPYKKPKTLSESIGILYLFKRDKHIDPELFDLLLTSGIYRRYAEKFLRPEQIDEVDIDRFLG